MRLVIVTITIALLALAGQARADDGKASAFLSRIGLSNVQISQAAGCANKCEVSGGASCDLATATGSTCVPVGTGCSCLGQQIGSGMGVVMGAAIRK
jgi:hypothetical protein